MTSLTVPHIHNIKTGRIFRKLQRRYRPQHKYKPNFFVWPPSSIPTKINAPPPLVPHKPSERIHHIPTTPDTPEPLSHACRRYGGRLQRQDCVARYISRPVHSGAAGCPHNMFTFAVPPSGSPFLRYLTFAPNILHLIPVDYLFPAFDKRQHALGS
jgi:hypothetical protein